ncbi:MAG: AsnC family transcriptional regulator [Pseudomonadota bacterium]
MSQKALQALVDRHLAHAAMVFVLDEELGMRHGLSWADFVLLSVLDAAGCAAPATELARTLHTPASRLLQQLLPLEKIGLVERTAGADGTRRIQLRPQGRRMLHEAQDTAENVCAP